MTKTYPTKTQATKAKKFGQQVYQRRDKSWAVRWPRDKKPGKGGVHDDDNLGRQ